MYFEFQRMPRAVVSWLATAKGEAALFEDAISVWEEEAGARVEVGVEDAVVKIAWWDGEERQ